MHAWAVEEVIKKTAGGGAAGPVGHPGAEGAVEGGGRGAEERVAHEGGRVRRVRVEGGVRVAVDAEETLEGIAGRDEGVVPAEKGPGRMRSLVIHRMMLCM